MSGSLDAVQTLSPPGPAAKGGRPGTGLPSPSPRLGRPQAAISKVAWLPRGDLGQAEWLDPGLEVPVEIALRSAEIDRLDWSFATQEGALNAMLSSDAVVAAPREVVATYVRDDVRRGPDGRFRFSFCPSAAVVAWSEMSLQAPPIARLPTLVIRAAVPLFPPDSTEESRYLEALGKLFTVTTVPGGHNVLWESPAETAEAIERFVAPAPANSS